MAPGDLISAGRYLAALHALQGQVNQAAQKETDVLSLDDAFPTGGGSTTLIKVLMDQSSSHFTRSFSIRFL